MRQINFGLIFSFGLITVFFTLANTNRHDGSCVAGCGVHPASRGLLLLAAGLGAVSAWFFAAWTGMLNNVEQFSKANEYEAQQVRIQELETDLSRYRSTVETQLGLLPATTVSATSAESDDNDQAEVTDASSAA